jgi:hypothetical protein
MTTSNAASSGQSGSAKTKPEFSEYILSRDHDAPLSFAGKILAEAQTSGVSLATITASLYQTRGGKFVTSLKKNDHIFAIQGVLNVDDYVSDKGNSSYSKVGIFDTLPEAVAWFRPGKLTDQIKSQLGLNKPVRIE